MRKTKKIILEPSYYILNRSSDKSSVTEFENRSTLGFCSFTMDRRIHVDDLDDKLSYVQPSFDGFVDLIKNDKKVINNINNLANYYLIFCYSICLPLINFYIFCINFKLTWWEKIVR